MPALSIRNQLIPLSHFFFVLGLVYMFRSERNNWLNQQTNSKVSNFLAEIVLTPNCYILAAWFKGMLMTNWSWPALIDYCILIMKTPLSLEMELWQAGEGEKLKYRCSSHSVLTQCLQYVKTAFWAQILEAGVHCHSLSNSDHRVFSALSWILIGWQQKKLFHF